MAIILSPEEAYSGVSFTVGFAAGKGETNDPWLIQRFKESGYTVQETSKPDKEAEDYSKWTVDELRKKAAALKLPDFYELNKKDLVVAVEAAIEKNKV
jgi:hypothetical protein